MYMSLHVNLLTEGCHSLFRFHNEAKPIAFVEDSDFFEVLKHSKEHE